MKGGAEPFAFSSSSSPVAIAKEIGDLECPSCGRGLRTHVKIFAAGGFTLSVAGGLLHATTVCHPCRIFVEVSVTDAWRERAGRGEQGAAGIRAIRDALEDGLLRGSYTDPRTRGATGPNAPGLYDQPVADSSVTDSTREAGA